MIADDWKCRSVLKSCAISLTSLWNGSFQISNSVLFWYLLISQSATVPGRYLWGFFTFCWPVGGFCLPVVFLSGFTFLASWGALPVAAVFQSLNGVPGVCFCGDALFLLFFALSRAALASRRTCFPALMAAFFAPTILNEETTC